MTRSAPEQEDPMIGIEKDSLVFTFPEVHESARLEINFERTLRIPDDGDDYPLPPGLGNFPLVRVEGLPKRAPQEWRDKGGVVLPMYQSEAMWLAFATDYVQGRDTRYPVAIKISAGRLNAVSGEAWRRGLHREPQDYVVSPGQPWLDGWCVDKGVIKQFVAMPLGSGYTGEEQLVKGDHWGGLRIAVYPMKRARFEKLFPERKHEPVRWHYAPPDTAGMVCCCESSSMGLGAGGRMRQEISEDGFKLSDWDRTHALACQVHIANSMVWKSLTGAQPPCPPPTAREYSQAGLPWFEWYSEKPAVKGAKGLAKLKTVKELDAKKGNVSLPENDSADPSLIVPLGPKACRGRVTGVSL
jgi:hypothetical protein